MTYIDVFNGDADGICALHQLRLAEPRESVLVTGVKRDIALLSQVEASPGDVITVLDISLDKNRDDLLRLLNTGSNVTYFDHHFAGDIPASEHLSAHIDTAPEVCTSLLVNTHLQGAYLPWAVTAAFGDNLHASARAAAAPLGLSEAQLADLQHLGECINYNGYGAKVDDLHFPPADLYRLIRPYADPFAFMAEEAGWHKLSDGFAADMQQARETQSEITEEKIAVIMFPNLSWARRVSGVYGNEVARQFPQRAHALLTPNADGSYLVSVRAPVQDRRDADTLCRRFPTGGGRAAAAGINALPAAMLDAFIEALRETYA